MKIHEYNEMMAYLMRPAKKEYLQRKSMRENAATGGRVGYKLGGIIKLYETAKKIYPLLKPGSKKELIKLFNIFKKNTVTVKRGESGTAGASGADSNPDYRGKYYTPEGGGFGNISEDARYYSKLGGPEGKPKVLTAELTPEEIIEGKRLRSLDADDPEIGDIILPPSAENKIKVDYLNTVRAKIEKILGMADGGRVGFSIGTKPDTVPNTQFAALADDLEPGSLKDEMLKDFDPSQETYEEYLQRKSLEDSTMGPGGYSMTASKLDLLKPKTYTDTIPQTFSKTKTVIKSLLNKIKPYQGSTQGIGKSTPKINRDPEKNFISAFNKFRDTYFGGNQSAASKAIGENRNKIKGIYDRTLGGPQRQTGSVSSGSQIRLNIPEPVDGIAYTDLTNITKTDLNYLNKFKTKENLNKFLSPKELGHSIGLKFENKKELDYFTNELNRFKVKKQNYSGKMNLYNFNDAIKKINLNPKKIIKGEVLSPTKRLKNENELDPDLFKIRNKIKSQLKSVSNDENIYISGAVDDLGHTVSIEITSKYPSLFKNSNVNKLNSLVYQDPYINRDVMKITGYESKFDSMFKELNSLVNKPVTVKTQQKILDIKQSMNENYNNLIENISNPKKLKNIIEDSGKEISSSHLQTISQQTDRIQKIDINIPKIGEKFQSQDLFVDMSKVNPNYIMGNVDKINPTAKKFKDLSLSEQALYEANLQLQNADILSDYYKKAGFQKQDIADLKDRLEYRSEGGRVGLAEGSEGLPSETLPAIAAAAYKAKKPITNFAKGAFKTVISPAVASAFAGSEMMDINPFRFAEEDEEGFVKLDEKFLSEKEGGNQSLAGLDLLYPNIARALGSKITTVKNFYNTLLNMGIPLKYAPRLISGMTGVGLIMIGGDVVQGIASLAGPDKRGPLTEEELIEMENKRTAMPRMLDTYEQAIKIAKDENISYSEALEKLKK